MPTDEEEIGHGKRPVMIYKGLRMSHIL